VIGRGHREFSSQVRVQEGGEGVLVSPPSVRLRLLAAGKRLNIGDFVFKNLTMLFALLVFMLVFFMALEMYRQSGPAIEKFGWGFLTSEAWDPVRGNFGALPFIFGTLFSSLLALVIALPLGLGVAIFLSEIAPRWLEQPVSFVVELLAAIPSIVYGLWGIFVLVPILRTSVEPFLRKSLGYLPFFKGAPYGFGMLAAVLILTVMILPIITSISRDVLRAIPDAQREAALALGATRWEMVKIIFGGAKSGILGATLLGLGRAVGETMAVTMVIGNTPSISWSLFSPGYSMASVIANEFSEATSELYTSALVEIALILFVMTLLLNAGARLIVWSVTRKFKNA
jgi:phosphate transport system permease protein